MNCGVIVCTPAIHLRAFEIFRLIFAASPAGLKANAHYEQALFNYCLHLGGVGVSHLGREWNRLSPPAGEVMAGEYIWHFTGLDGAEQKPRIGKVSW